MIARDARSSGRWFRLAGALLILAGMLVAGTGRGAAETPLCRQPLPRATTGALHLDRAVVAPGEKVALIVSGFTGWPVHLFGGSGETFVYCAPWKPFPQAVVMWRHDPVGLFTITVPPDQPGGTYPINLMFFEGPSRPLSGGKLVRLGVQLTVAPGAQQAAGASQVCRLPIAVATTGGSLQSPDPVRAGTVVPVSVAGAQGTDYSLIDEYGRLNYIACLQGRSSVITGLSSANADFSLAVPGASDPGRQQLKVIGLSGPALGYWAKYLTVLAAAPPAALTFAPATPAAGASVTASGHCDGATSISLISEAFDRSGGHDWDGRNGVWQFAGTGPDGTFSGPLTISDQALGQYAVTMRCGGGLAGRFTVTVGAAPLPATGGAVRTTFGAAAVVLAAGLMLLLLGRRRRSMSRR